MIGWALKYASLGWHVFPVKSDKKPYIDGWPDKASKDATQINAWWSKWPDASIGAACGPKSGIWVLDVDLPDGPFALSVMVDSQPFPATMKQQTGGGGEQYIWRWNTNKPVRNRTNVPAKNIDVRGEGGYVILPPSTHQSGNKYSWVLKTKVADAPDWLLDLVYVEEKPQPTATGSATNTRYGEAALRNGLDRLSKASEGTRNDTLNKVALGLGHLIAGEELDRVYVESSLADMALKIGLEGKEAQKTIESGINKGMQDPKKVTDDDRKYYLDPKELDEQKINNEQNEQDKHTVSTNEQLMSNDEQVMSKPTILMSNNEQEKKRASYSLANAIKDWVINSSGSFTNDQIDREFCLKTRTEKNNRSQCLYILQRQNLIKKDKSIKGKWHVANNDVDWVDLDAASESSFPIILPFNLHELVSIPNKSIIVVAGSTNAGKTAFLLNTLAMNLEQQYGLIYLKSEMGDNEYKRRVLRLNASYDTWKKRVMSANCSCNFEDIVQKHNPDGLTCIDYLQEIEGEYFKIPGAIKDIYESLHDGVALVAIQKLSTAAVGRGGEGTMERPRLYVTMDYLCTLEKAVVCAVVITKAKESIDDNMNHKELHFKIENGAQMTVLMDWTPQGKVSRTKCILEYQSGNGEPQHYVYKFLTKEGREVGVVQRDVDKWKAMFKNFDVDEELARIQRFSQSAPWLEGNWYLHLKGWLKRKEENS